MTETNSLVASPLKALEGAVVEFEIRVNRERLLQHLKRVYCNKTIVEATFSGPLRTTALAWEQDVLVVTRGLPDIEPLPTPVGLKLEPLIGTLNCLEGKDIELRLESGHLVCVSGGRRIRVRPVEPDLTHTQPEPVMLDKVLAKIPGDAWQTFSPDIAKAVVQAISGLGAEQVAVRVGPSGMTIIVGDPVLDTVEFDVEVTSEASYALLLDAKRVRDALAQVGDSHPAIGLIGPNAVMGLRLESPDRSVDPPDIDVLYIISPLKETRGPDGDLPSPA